MGGVLALACLIKAMTMALKVPFTQSDANRYMSLTDEYLKYIAARAPDYKVPSYKCVPP